MGKDKIIFVCIYLGVLSFMLWYNLSHQPVNDGVLEYHVFQMNVEEGWQYRHDTIINSCLVTTWMPAELHRISGWDAYTLFRIFPCFFYALMPSFAFLIARRYLSNAQAGIAATVVITGSFIIFFPDMGRVGVGWGFLAGMIWALLEKRWWWSLIFATLVVFSHYGTLLIAIGSVAVLFLGQLIIKRHFVKQFALVLSVLVVLMFLWHFWIVGSSGFYFMRAFERVGNAPLMYQGDNYWFDIEAREGVLQEAFGVNISGMNTPQRIELITTWLMVLLISAGMILLIRKKMGDFNTRVLAVVLYVLIIITAAVPWMSVYYGAQRIYFTALILIAPCFYLAVKYIAEKIKIPSYALAAVVFIPYILSVSGLLYVPFGVVK